MRRLEKGENRALEIPGALFSCKNGDVRPWFLPRRAAVRGGSYTGRAFCIVYKVALHSLGFQGILKGTTGDRNNAAQTHEVSG